MTTTRQTFLILPGVRQSGNEVIKSRKQRQRKIEKTWLSNAEEAGLNRDIISVQPSAEHPYHPASKVWGILWKEKN